MEKKTLRTETHEMMEFSFPSPSFPQKIVCQCLCVLYQIQKIFMKIPTDDFLNERYICMHDVMLYYVYTNQLNNVIAYGDEN